ncbi:MAG: flagellar hook-basal body complex protein FliE [Gemmatimonadales bacterium]|nr:MAG: flagellar hook-basal body complex protein FliE [Gemmatimonadales bacterium]
MDAITGAGSIHSQALRAIQQAAGGGQPPQAPESGTGFADTLKRVIGDASELQVESQNAIDAFVRGDPIEIHQVMAAVEEAGIALELLIEIRNRLTEAYRTVIQMQN